MLPIERNPLPSPETWLEYESILADREIMISGWRRLLGQPVDGVAGDAAHRILWYRTLIKSPETPSKASLTPFFAVRDGCRFALPQQSDAAEVSAEVRTLIDWSFSDASLHQYIPAEIDEVQVGRINDALDLVRLTMGYTSHNPTEFISGIAIMKSGIPSLYLSRTPELIYVSDALFNSELWRLGDAILHESLHDVSEAMRQLRYLFAPGYSEASSTTTLLPWSANYSQPRYFTTWRLLSALHVYAHFSAFRARIRVTQEAVQIPILRAQFMLNALRTDPGHSEYLGTDGWNLLKWIDEILSTPEVQKYVY